MSSWKQIKYINILNDQCSMQWSIPCIQSMHCLSDCVAICLPSEWCHCLHTCGISMGFPFQPKWHCEVWRVWWIILQYNATLCVTLCYPHHLLGQLLFALSHQFTSVKSLKRYLFRRVFAWISFACRFNALLRTSQCNILNHITKCLTNLMYTGCPKKTHFQNYQGYICGDQFFWLFWTSITAVVILGPFWSFWLF